MEIPSCISMFRLKYQQTISRVAGVVTVGKSRAAPLLPHLPCCPAL